MYIYIVEEILKDKSLSGSEKIVLSLIKLLTEKGKSFYGGASYLAEECGLQDAHLVLLSLEAKARVKNRGGNFVYSYDVIEKSAIVDDIICRPADELQALRVKIEARGFELVREEERRFVYSNRMETFYINKFK